MAPERLGARLDAGPAARADPRPARERGREDLPAHPDRRDRGGRAGRRDRGGQVGARPARLRRPLHAGGGDASPVRPTTAASGCRRGSSSPTRSRPCSADAGCASPSPLVAAASMWAAWRSSSRTRRVGCGPRGSSCCSPALASSAFAALLDTVAELRRTRAELARVAVAEERERFSRDLHDLLGHTLSVMVVKAQAVRRLAATDPDAAAEHAADIEQIGRQALVDVRQAVDAMRAPTLRRGAGRCATRARRRRHPRPRSTSADRASPADARTRCWPGSLREGATNVLRHSGASACRIALTDARRRGSR